VIRALATAFTLLLPAAALAEDAAAPAAPAFATGGLVESGAPAPLPPPKPVAVDYKKFRDPFKEPVISETTIVRSDLERFAVTDFKVTGIITGPLRMRAMVLAPDGKTHYVTDGMKMGMRDGIIVRITTKTVVVREKVVNPLGEVEQFDTEIGLDQQAGANTSAQQ
jgi:Tfp pilus assembly protein PilP